MLVRFGPIPATGGRGSLSEVLRRAPGDSSFRNVPESGGNTYVSRRHGT